MSIDREIKTNYENSDLIRVLVCHDCGAMIYPGFAQKHLEHHGVSNPDKAIAKAYGYWFTSHYLREEY